MKKNHLEIDGFLLQSIKEKKYQPAEVFRGHFIMKGCVKNYFKYFDVGESGTKSYRGKCSTISDS